MSVQIGDKDCMPVAVFNKMDESPGGGLLSKWKELAHNLEISDDAIDQLSRDQDLRKMKTGEIYIEMLKTYRSEKKDKATLKNLIFVLENKLNMGDIGSILTPWLEEILREREAQKSNSNIPPEVPAKKPATLGVEANQSNPNQTSNIPGRPKYSLDFGDRDLKTKVIPACDPEFRTMLSHKGTNDQIISELKALDVFEISEINIVANHQYKDEAERIGELMLLLEKFDDKDILKCLEKLCNLKSRPKKSENIREKLKELFPGCVKENKETEFCKI